MKKGLKILFIILGIVVVLGIIFFMIDYNRVKKQEKPIFCIPSLAGIYLDGGTIEYFGLGYKVIDFNRLGGYDEIKIGTWFMDYNDFADEYEKEPGLIPAEQLEITGFDIESSITIDGEDYKTILGILKSLTYNQELCDGINNYAIKLNDGTGTTYFVKSDCNCVSTNGKQAEISDKHLQEIENIIQKAIKDSNTTFPYIPDGISEANPNDIETSVKEETYNRSPENVTIEVLKDTITKESAEIIITDNNEEHYGWGVSFRVQKKVNENWQELDWISDDLTFIEIAYELGEDNQIQMKVDYGKYYGSLKEGIYRIVKPVYDKEYIDLYSNEFEIK